jgi:hypothetical protein
MVGGGSVDDGGGFRRGMSLYRLRKGCFGLLTLGFSGAFRLAFAGSCDFGRDGNGVLSVPWGLNCG